MALSDAQIERYSRQIVLPEVGAAGQQRLLTSSCLVAGDGDLAATAARYLVGAGIGSLVLVGASAASLAAELAALNPDVQLQARPDNAVATSGQPSSRVDVVIAAAIASTELDALAQTTKADTIIACGFRSNGGWLYTSHDSGCAVCAARAANHPQPARTTWSAVAASAVGAIAALAALKACLGRTTDVGDAWYEYDATAATLVARALVRDPDCAACAARP